MHVLYIRDSQAFCYRNGAECGTEDVSHCLTVGSHWMCDGDKTAGWDSCGLEEFHIIGDRPPKIAKVTRLKDRS